MISILIPTYNYNVLPLVKALHEQLKLSQTAFELRVYEDGSTKPSLENDEISNFENTVYKKFATNIGRTAIRSLMASEAKYDWLLFLDADVLPQDATFLKRYIEEIRQNDADVIVGGVAYEKKKPQKDKILRWKYGHFREAKPVKIRKKNPYTIVSPNLCLKKTVFLCANIQIGNYYGLDNFLSNQLKSMQVKVLHIDNPVIHFGLEENDIFIRKALNAVETTVVLESKGLMDHDMRPLQKSYLKLKKLYLQNIFSFVISSFKSRMERNFNSKNPNLIWFDLYRLNYYIQLKKKQDA